jgi:hypothetical protein
MTYVIVSCEHFLGILALVGDSSYVADHRVFQLAVKLDTDAKLGH